MDVCPALTVEGLARRVHVGAGFVTVTVAAQMDVPWAFVTGRLKVVLAARAAVVQLPPEELVKVVHVPLEGLKVKSAGPLVIAQYSVDVCPDLIMAGLAVRLHVGAKVVPEPVTVTVAAQLSVPFELVTGKLKVVVETRAAVMQLPEDWFVNEEQPPLVGLKVPSAGPFVIAQYSVAVCPAFVVVGLAVRAHVGGKVVVDGTTVTVAEQLAVPLAVVTGRIKVVVAAIAPVAQLPELELAKDEQLPLVGLKTPLAGPLFIAQ